MNRPKRNLHMLLVDDDPSDVQIVKAVLRDLGGVKLSVVSDGEEAMSFVRREGKYATEPLPNLILIDLNMPRKDGREVLAELKSDDGLKHIPVIVFSTSNADSDIQTAYRLQASAFVTKPGNLTDFRNVVRGVADYWLLFAIPPLS